MSNNTARFTNKDASAALYAALIGFLTYASVYAYRKPFTVATFEGIQFRQVSYQTLLVISQVIGYMLSKFTGIRFIAELKHLGRWKTSLILIGSAWLSLLVFALIPAPYGMLCLLVNGYMLGFMWGIVFSYVEGRRATDFIGAAMAVSFIFAGGFTRSVAVWVRDHWQVTDPWIGFVTGAVFILPLLLFLYLIEKIPPPTPEDIAERTIRIPMNRETRSKIIRQFGTGLFFVTITYVFLTIMRDIRDNFMANMWNDLGYGKKPEIFTQTETITSITVLLIMALLVTVRNNFRAFRLIHLVVIAGFLTAGIASAFFVAGKLNGILWMQLAGLGLYMGYIPFNCILFERFIAAFRIQGNVGFLIYLADAFGYLGSVAVLLTKEFMQVKMNWVVFYSNGVMVFAIIGIAGTALSYIYFKRKFRDAAHATT